MKESFEKKQERVKKLIKAFEKTYPDVHCELNFANPLELMVATILSAQCTDKRVNIVTKALFKNFRTASDYARAGLPELEEAIRSTGFYRNKAKNIQAACRKLVERHGGSVPRTMEALTGLDGVGRKTANVILGTAFDVNEGVVVDTHVTRLSGRLKLSTHQQPEKIEQDLMKLVPGKYWALWSHWLIWHGRRRCSARKPDCPNCEVKDLCPSAGRAK